MFCLRWLASNQSVSSVKSFRRFPPRLNGNQTGLLGRVVRTLNQNEAVIVAHNLNGINRQYFKKKEKAWPWGTLVFKTGSLDRQTFNLTCQSWLHRNSLIHKIKWNGFQIHTGIWPEFVSLTGWGKVHQKADGEVFRYNKEKSFNVVLF